MKRVSLVATKPIHYRGRSIKIGETFEANSDHARLYVAIKQAKLAPAPAEPVAAAAPQPAPPVYQTRAIQPEPPLPAEPVLPSSEEPEAPRRRAAYRRRDMRVEE